MSVGSSNVGVNQSGKSGGEAFGGAGAGSFAGAGGGLGIGEGVGVLGGGAGVGVGGGGSAGSGAGAIGAAGGDVSDNTSIGSININS